MGTVQGEGVAVEAIRQGAGDTQKESLGLTLTAQPEAQTYRYGSTTRHKPLRST